MLRAAVNNHEMPNLDVNLSYGVNTYSVDWCNLKYRRNRWSDSHGVFSIVFRTEKMRTFNFWIPKQMVKSWKDTMHSC